MIMQTLQMYSMVFQTINIIVCVILIVTIVRNK